MTDQLERIFVEVSYEDGSAEADSVIKELQERLDGLPQKFNITKNRPPRIFTDKEIEDRFFHLFQAALLFQERFQNKYGIELELDPRILYVATISAYDDIERYKAYHLEKPYRDRSDAVKRSAFLTKWLSKIGPFQTSVDLEFELQQLAKGEFSVVSKPALANILFAIMVSMGHISIDCKRRTWLTPYAEYHLSYDLLYRRINEDALLAKYQKIVDLVVGNEILMH